MSGNTGLVSLVENVFLGFLLILPSHHLLLMTWSPHCEIEWALFFSLSFLSKSTV